MEIINHYLIKKAKIVNRSLILLTLNLVYSIGLTYVFLHGTQHKPSALEPDGFPGMLQTPLLVEIFPTRSKKQLFMVIEYLINIGQRNKLIAVLCLYDTIVFIFIFPLHLYLSHNSNKLNTPLFILQSHLLVFVCCDELVL